MGEEVVNRNDMGDPKEAFTEVEFYDFNGQEVVAVYWVPNLDRKSVV